MVRVLILAAVLALSGCGDLTINHGDTTPHKCQPPPSMPNGIPSTNWC